jgi:hypothetical protein
LPRPPQSPGPAARGRRLSHRSATGAGSWS